MLATNLRTGDAEAMPATRVAAIVIDNFILTFSTCLQKRRKERAKRGLHQMATPVEANKRMTIDQKSVWGKEKTTRTTEEDWR